ncbi:hypothetical protein Tco_0215358 [Tanacetum coccineum]
METETETDGKYLENDFLVEFWAEAVASGQIDSTCQLRGNIDSNGYTSAFLKELLNTEFDFILSAESIELLLRNFVNAVRPQEDYKFGFGFTVGE